MSKPTYAEALPLASMPALEAIEWRYGGPLEVVNHQRAMQLIQRNNIRSLGELRAQTTEANSPELWAEDAVSPSFSQEYSIGTSRVFASYLAGVRVEGEVIDGMTNQNSGIDALVAWLKRDTPGEPPEVHAVLQSVFCLSMVERMQLTAVLMGKQLMTRRCLLAGSPASDLGSILPEPPVTSGL